MNKGLLPLRHFPLLVIIITKLQNNVMRCARDIFDQILEEKSMSKKWLYGVALGALLIAQPSWGITVQDVLSKGFFSVDEHRETLKSLQADGEYVWKVKDLKPKDGLERFLEKYKSGPWSTRKWKWKGLWSFTNNEASDCMYVLTNKQKHHKEKTKGELHSTYGDADSTVSQESYVGKPKGKGTRPLGPFVVYDWFPGVVMASNDYVNVQFNGTEETATTNVISDCEAYITRTIRQSGWVQAYFGYVVEEPASLLRVYNMHITTDADHVYIHQDVNETAQNAPFSDIQRTYATDYTATFKKDRFVSETETIQKNEQIWASDWWGRYFNRNSAADMATTSVQAQPALKAKHTRLARTDDSNQRSQ
jgi:hypothetical protein